MILLVDTSNKYLIISLLDNGNNILDFKKVLLGKEMTKYANYNIQKFLKDNNTNLNDITKLYIVNGPGSFTGIKISMVFANVLKTMNPDLKLYSASSLDFAKKDKKEVIIYSTKTSYFTKKGMISKVINVPDVSKYNNSYEIIDSDNVSNNLRKFKRVKRIKPKYMKGVI